MMLTATSDLSRHRAALGVVTADGAGVPFLRRCSSVSAGFTVVFERGSSIDDPMLVVSERKHAAPRVKGAATGQP
jgi:hypothetical protein